MNNYFITLTPKKKGYIGGEALVDLYRLFGLTIDEHIDRNNEKGTSSHPGTGTSAWYMQLDPINEWGLKHDDLVCIIADTGTADTYTRLINMGMCSSRAIKTYANGSGKRRLQLYSVNLVIAYIKMRTGKDASMVLNNMQLMEFNITDGELLTYHTVRVEESEYKKRKVIPTIPLPSRQKTLPLNVTKDNLDICNLDICDLYDDKVSNLFNPLMEEERCKLGRQLYAVMSSTSKEYRTNYTINAIDIVHPIIQYYKRKADGNKKEDK